MRRRLLVDPDLKNAVPVFVPAAAFLTPIASSGAWPRRRRTARARSLRASAATPARRRGRATASSAHPRVCITARACRAEVSLISVRAALIASPPARPIEHSAPRAMPRALYRAPALEPSAAARSQAAAGSPDRHPQPPTAHRPRQPIGTTSNELCRVSPHTSPASSRPQTNSSMRPRSRAADDGQLNPPTKPARRNTSLR